MDDLVKRAKNGDNRIAFDGGYSETAAEGTIDQLVDEVERLQQLIEELEQAVEFYKLEIISEIAERKQLEQLCASRLERNAVYGREIGKRMDENWRLQQRINNQRKEITRLLASQPPTEGKSND